MGPSVESEREFPMGIFGVCLFGVFVIHFLERWSIWIAPTELTQMSGVAGLGAPRFLRVDSSRFETVSMAYPWCEYGVRIRLMGPDVDVIEYTVSNFVESLVVSDGVQDSDLEVERVSQALSTALDVVAAAGLGESPKLRLALSQRSMMWSNYRSSFFEPPL